MLYILADKLLLRVVSFIGDGLTDSLNGLSTMEVRIVECQLRSSMFLHIVEKKQEIISLAFHVYQVIKNR